MSRAAFAKLVGVSASAVETWEQGKSVPGAGSREALARITEMGQGEQVGGESTAHRTVPRRDTGHP